MQQFQDDIMKNRMYTKELFDKLKYEIGELEKRISDLEKSHISMQ